MQHRTQRQLLEDNLAQLELNLQLTQRKIIRIHVQLELLNDRKRHLTTSVSSQQHRLTQSNQYNHTYNNNNNNHHNNNINNNDNNNSASNNNTQDDNNQSSSDSSSDTEDNNDDNTSDDEANHFKYSDGSYVNLGDKVALLNPNEDSEQTGIVVDNTPKRLKIQLLNGEYVLRNPENTRKI